MVLIVIVVIRDLPKRLYIHGDVKLYPLIGGNVNVKHIRAYWDDSLYHTIAAGLGAH